MSAGDSPHADRHEPSLDEALRRLADQLMAEHGIRREGAVMPADRFERVAAELRGGYGWN